MQTTVAPRPVPVVRPRPEARFADTRATLAALGAALLAMMGVVEH